MLYLAPRVLERALGVDLLAVQAWFDFGGIVFELDPERVGERVRGIGRQDERLVPAPRRLHRRRGRGRRLADAALAGEQQHAHRCRLSRGRNQAPDSTRFLSPFKAVSMMTFSA